MMRYIVLWCATCTVLSSTGVPFNARSTAHLCMITAPRKHAYVLETSRAILSQITETGLGSRVTLSINVAGSAADVIDSPLAAALENRALATGPDCLTNEDTDPLPPCGVRQQGLDVANALATCQRRNPGVDWIVLLEDDFMPCDNHTLARLLDTLDTLDPRTTKFARFTQGGGGVAFPSAHALLYTQSILHHIASMPHDRVLLEPWSAEKDYVFAKHLFKHIGSVSTIGYRNTQEYVREYSRLRDNECGDQISV